MMKEVVAEALNIYFKKMREPTLAEMWKIDEKLLAEKSCCFVTLYLNGEVHGSSGNIKEIHSSIAQELISNTIAALTHDKRFSPLTLDEADKLQYRIDKIVDRGMISLDDLKKLDPVSSGVIAIKRDYEKVAIILPNMSPKILTWEDFIPVLLNKMGERKLENDDYILYKITTEVETNY